MAEQTILKASVHYKELDEYLKKNKASKIFLVCDQALPFLRINHYFNDLESRTGISVVKFSNFKPNPRYESVVEGVTLFHKENCDLIIAVGGGSAIDVAKCIKLYANMDEKQNYLTQLIVPNSIELLAVPTTAGTGSEATRYAVIYFQEEKQSVSDDSCIPGTVLMDPSVLKTLPMYQKKSTMMDAFCHGVESFWSVNSTEQSREFSRIAIQSILSHKNAYLENKDTGNVGMLEAANLAGRAINITQTTAGHALCYKLTSLYGIAHGHAAALCLFRLWPYMAAHMEQCIDPRGPQHLKKIFLEIAYAMGCDTVDGAVIKFQKLFTELALPVPAPENRDYTVLKKSVNAVRLKNNPIVLDEKAIDTLYHQILSH